MEAKRELTGQDLINKIQEIKKHLEKNETIKLKMNQQTREIIMYIEKLKRIEA